MLAHPGRALTARVPACLPTSRPFRQWRPSSQIYFVGPEGLTVQWDVTAPGRFDSEQLVAPARYNFPQGAMYRLKLANIPGRPGVELFPTLEVGPAMPRTEAFLAHSAIPVEFTDEDFDQVMTGNFVTKVIYLPDPEFQEMALAGVGTLVSTRARSGRRPDRRSRPPRGHHGHRPLGQQGPGHRFGHGRADAGRPDGHARPLPAAGLCGRHDRAAVRHADHAARRSDWPDLRTIPLGVPAGLQKHTIVNHTHVSLPQPVTHERIDVKAGAGDPLSRAGQPCPHRGTNVGHRQTCFGPLPDRRRHGALPAARPTAACPTGN